ncbi:MAG TPA: DUF167 domain-containing protein [Phycisphaerales bacterium]|nr:DUF167 domain-containing protein [Phycisphaerales bacterium]
MPLRIESDGSAVRLWIKAVPGASRDQIAGVLGERLKVRVTAPAEDGRANQAICATIARALKIKLKQVTIESGRTNPEKVVRIEGVSVELVRAMIV